MQNTNYQNPKRFDLEPRTQKFAGDCRVFVKKLPRSVANIEDGKQLIRSSGSTGANYIEANEAISRKDFYHRIKICRKEAKESRYWLNLIDAGSEPAETEKKRLIQEATELMKIFGSILEKEVTKKY